MVEKAIFIKNQKIGFIGPGKMGYGIIKNLCEKLDFKKMTILEHSNKINIGYLKKSNINVFLTKSAEEVFKNSDIVFICLSNSEITETVLFSADVQKVIRPNTTIIDLTTQSKEFTDKAINFALNHNISYFDCPLIRSPENALQGTLITLAGGISEETTEWSLLKVFSEEVFCFPLGSATKYKLLNNYICMSFNVVIQTALVYADKLQLDRLKLEEIMKLGTNYIPALSSMNQYIQTENKKILNFLIKDARKDLEYFHSLVKDENFIFNIKICETIIAILSHKKIKEEDTLPLLYSKMKEGQ